MEYSVIFTDSIGRPLHTLQIQNPGHISLEILARILGRAPVKDGQTDLHEGRMDQMLSGIQIDQGGLVRITAFLEGPIMGCREQQIDLRIFFEAPERVLYNNSDKEPPSLLRTDRRPVGNRLEPKVSMPSARASDSKASLRLAGT